MAFTIPASLERCTLVITTGIESGQTTFDLAGGQRAGPLGIYSLTGDTRLVCLGKTRPAEFSAHSGSDNLLIALKRVPTPEPMEVTPPASVPAPAPAPVPAPAPPQRSMRDRLIGTWGSQNNESISHYTLNADGSFSSTHEFKRGFRRWFDNDVRSSGTWTVEGNVVIVRITRSTDRDRQGQVFSYKVNTLNDRDAIVVDQQGQVRREWRVR